MLHDMDGIPVLSFSPRAREQDFTPDGLEELIEFLGSMKNALAKGESSVDAYKHAALESMARENNKV